MELLTYDEYIGCHNIKLGDDIKIDNNSIF